jgi:hypothetical protein
MEGFEALATLTKKLCGLPASRITNSDDIKDVMKYVKQYIATSDRVDTILDNEGSRKYFEHLFIPTDRFATYPDDVPDPPNFGNVKVWMDSIYAMKVVIQGAYEQQKFPVQQFKFVLLNTLKNWEGMYLPKPDLFNVGRYFKLKGEEALLSTIATKSESKGDIV